MVTKIFCVYHKKAPEVINRFMYRYPDIFVPILSGACNYNSGTSKLFDLFVKDNDGLNVSRMDGKFSEHTAIFWVYEHYKEIGNPDMIGLCHYRRILSLDYDNLDKNAVYLRRTIDHFSERAKKAIFVYGGGKSVYEYVMDTYLNVFPEHKDAVEYMLDDYSFYDKNMFVMSRERFTEYMRHMIRCYMLLCDSNLIGQFVKWYNYQPSRVIHDYLSGRAASVMAEMFSGIYFQNLKMKNVPIIVTQPVEGTFVGY